VQGLGGRLKRFFSRFRGLGLGVGVGSYKCISGGGHVKEFD